ncbi:ADP-ribose glycohydrolase MACROD2 isoform X1 [Entelurus aequoreus]|uniref:ADP-ribose glycohydrolase MACROD2 isoform X1 n=2 Tax=Entelurus aequoreus TaxID=161455 RepID=UPI002B1E025D|nr:ADP-ribose glycohydrolase MACROD2 isoform X1 [Entelurus aequoreus]XP_061914464.1 ADP-ribose glycohydrolase MACROD2 isoform X1 [Entelurus aequoreus]
MSKKKKDWKTEKERLLQMEREERRKEGYRRQDYISLDKIPTWREDNYADSKEEGGLLTGVGGLNDKVSLYKGDITVLELDAIVNAANSSLLGGGGVDGCIHKAAGPCLYDECQTLNGCDTGKAKITCGYDLPARFVIHTVGPVARGHVGPTETNDLTSCYQNSLRLVKEYGLSTVAFPCISTGIYGFPNDPAADIALNTVKRWIEENPNSITRVIFCVFLETDFTIYKKKMSFVFQDNDMEVAEEQLKRDNTPPLSKSTTKDDIDSNKGKEEAGDEDEDDNDAEGTEDVVMESQNPDEDLGHKEMSQDRVEDQNKNQDTDVDKNEDEDTTFDSKDKDEAEEEQTAPKTDDEDTGKATVEMEDVSETAETGTSNGEDEKDPVESSEEPTSTQTDSIKSKDAAEKKE